ncbi:hypothetical protein [Azohydromonas aeria]|uniref:hypothetical protein n=1 Tax=Azohydromonas aeria TaxID=2590212 RepID=UPI0012F8E8D8|nr:hypothetical protein [Azohydromonas aeria]
MASVLSLYRRRNNTSSVAFEDTQPAQPLEPGFTPGPYLVGVNGQMVFADEDGKQRLVAIVVSGAADRVQLPFRETAHLLKAAPDLFTVAQAVQRLPDPTEVTLADLHSLTEQIRMLKESASWATQRALGELG